MRQKSVKFEQPPVSSLTEFREVFARYQTRMGWAFVFWIGGIFALMFGLFAIGILLEGYGVSIGSLWAVMMFATLFPYVFGGIWLVTLLTRDPRLRCRQCDYQWESGLQLLLVLVTRRCLKCGTALFADYSTSPPKFNHNDEHSLLSRIEIESAHRERMREARSRFKWRLVAGVVWFLFAAFANKFLKTQFTAELGEIGVALLPVTAFPGFLIIISGLLVKTSASTKPQPCPHCDKPIHPNDYSMVTGNCSYCGKRIVADPNPGLESDIDGQMAPQWEVDDFYAQANSLQRRLPFIALLVLIHTSLWFTVGFAFLPLPKDGAQTMRELNALFLLFGGAAIIPVGAILCDRYLSRNLRCQSCGNRLLSAYRLVISSHRCVGCGATVIGNSR